MIFHFNALTLLAEQQEGHPPVKKLGVGFRGPSSPEIPEISKLS